MITLTSLGGAGAVTGSEHLLEADALRLKIQDKLGWDCVAPQMMEPHAL